MEDIQLLGVLAQMGNTLNGRGAGADDGNAFVRQFRKPTLRIATCVAVVPATGVEGVTFEGFDTGNARQFRPVERAIGHHYKARLHTVVAIGCNDPFAFCFVPTHVVNLRLKAGLAIQIKLFADGARVGENFRCERVFLFRDVADFLEERQVDVCLNVALRAGIAIPVPGTAEVAGLFDDANVCHACFA